MATHQDLPATDSATALRELVGDDATASFESDPTFIGNNPGDTASSNNLQTGADRREIQAQPDINPLAAAAEEDDDEEDEDEEDDLDDDDDDDDDLEDEDEDELDDEDEDDDLDEDDDDEDEDEDDA